MRYLDAEHFYLECNSSICFPLEDRGMKVISSTQNPSKTQAFVASVLGVPANKVSCIVKRCAINTPSFVI